MIGRDMLHQVGLLLKPLRMQVANLVARAVVQVVDDGSTLQDVQLGVLDGEDIDDGERFQQYGFSSVPLPGAEAVVVFPSGDRGHPLVVAVDDRRYRPTGLQPGEVAFYHKDGARVVFKDGGDVEIYPGTGGEVRIGSASASDPVALKSELDTLKTAITNTVVVAADGGASFKSTLLTGLAAWPVGAQKVKAV